MQTHPTVTRALRDRWRARRSPWPDGAKTVVAVVIDFDGPSHDVGQGFAPFGSHSTGRYSARRGVPRLLEILARLNVPATFFIPGYDAQCYPQSVLDIAAAGHEVGAHGYLHERTLFPPDEEERRLVLTHDILTDLVGRPPVGWRSPSGRKTYTTLRVLKELGYRYDTSDKDFDMPYTVVFGDGRSMIEIPNNTFSLDDFPWFSHSMTPVSEVLAAWQEEFTTIHEERGFYLLSLHPRSGWGSGTPTRAAALETFLQWAGSHDGVTFMTLADVATWVAGNSDAFEEVEL